MITPIPAWGFGPPAALDPYQSAVANDTQGVLLVAAAAGAGKTRTAVERTLALMRQGVPPEAILMLAFNTNAVETMRERIEAACPLSASRSHVYTFHSWCYRLLRFWFPQETRFNRIIDTPQGPPRAKIARDVLKGMGLKVDKVYEYLDLCNLAAEALFDVRQHNAAPLAQAQFGLDEKGAMDWVRFAQEYTQAKARHGAIDFSDMLLEVGLWIQGAPQAPHVAALQNSYLHVVVDECQDMSPARFTVAQHLGYHAYTTPQERSLAYFGDARQGINGFAGAKIDLLLQLANDPQVKKYVLPTNYRSTQRIVARANEIAHGQEWNLGGATVHHGGAAEGEPVQVWYTSEEEEGADIARDISRRLPELGWVSPSGHPNFLVLARTSAVLYRVEAAFIAREMPCRIVGAAGGLWGSLLGGRFLSYLRAADGVVDFGLLDVANVPKRFAKREAVVTALRDTEMLNKMHLDPSRLAQTLILSQDRGTQRLGRDIDMLRSFDWAQRVTHVAQFLRRGLADKGPGHDSAENDEEAAIEVISHQAQQLGSLQRIDEARQAQARLSQDAASTVVLSTIHRQKGQEGTVCYLAGCADGILPHKRCTATMDEERRLFYVASTRAIRALIVSTGTPKTGRPSRFLAECWGEEFGPAFSATSAPPEAKPAKPPRKRSARPKDPARATR